MAVLLRPRLRRLLRQSQQVQQTQHENNAPAMAEHLNDAIPSAQSPCARCAAKYPSCCVAEKGREQEGFPLLPEEMERIERYYTELTGRKPFFIQHPSNAEFMAIITRLFPSDAPALGEIFPANSTHFCLASRRAETQKNAEPQRDMAGSASKTKGLKGSSEEDASDNEIRDNTADMLSHKDGACVFLTPQGCLLPRDCRPYFCRIFPFWFLPNGMMTMFNPAQCLLVEECPTFIEALDAMDCQEQELRALFAQLRASLGLCPRL